MVSLSHIFNYHSENLQLPEKFTRFLKQLNSGAEFLMLMLNNLLDISAFEMNAVSVNPETIDISQCCAGIANLVQPLADEKNITIQIHHHFEQKTLKIDQTRLSQLTLNLLHNAIKFSPRGGTIFIDVHRQPDLLKFEIRDQGPGIPHEERDGVFDMFTHGKGGASHPSSSGLGLSIVLRNVELLKGTIEIEQAQPHGAIFKVAIPLNK